MILKIGTNENLCINEDCRLKFNNINWSIVLLITPSPSLNAGFQKNKDFATFLLIFNRQHLFKLIINRRYRLQLIAHSFIVNKYHLKVTFIHTLCSRSLYKQSSFTSDCDLITLCISLENNWTNFIVCISWLQLYLTSWQCIHDYRKHGKYQEVQCHAFLQL